MNLNNRGITKNFLRDEFDFTVNQDVARKSLESWITQETPLDRIWTNIAWSPELKRLVVTSHSGGPNGIMTSDDGGITWIVRNTPNNQWRGIAWSPKLKLFVIVAGNGAGDRVATSPDGITWTLGVTPADNIWRYVEWIPELEIFVAVAHVTTGGFNGVMTSVDGFTWIIRTTPENTNYNDIAWSPELGLMVVVSDSGNYRIIVSKNGINWTPIVSPLPLEQIQGICWSPQLGIFVAVCYNLGVGDRVLVSKDGYNWDTAAASANNHWLSVAWSPEFGAFAAVADNAVDGVMISFDGYNWEAQTPDQLRAWRRIIWVEELGCFVSIAYYFSGPTGNLIMKSGSADHDQQYLSIYGRSGGQTVQGPVDFRGQLKAAVSEYADNAAALLGGLTIGDIYRTGDNLKIVH